MSEEQLRHELVDSFKNRAILYYLIYDEMRRELGPEKAEAILSRAIYRRGAQKGKQKYGQYGPANLAAASGRHSSAPAPMAAGCSSPRSSARMPRGWT